ncbi:MAG: transposase [Wolbachia sp.]|nr:transposase [Wolbachia sp.]
MLISTSPSMVLSKLVQYIKGKSSHKLSKKFEHLRKRICQFIKEILQLFFGASLCLYITLGHCTTIHKGVFHFFYT